MDGGLAAASRPAMRIVGAAIGLAVLAVLFAVGRVNFLLFHALVELGATAVAWGVFLLVWNARGLGIFPGLAILGVGYAFVGLTGLLHTLAYEGVYVLSGGANRSTQLWLATRYLEVASLGLMAVSLRVSISVWRGSAALVALAGGLLAAIFWWDVFPLCFDPETGLTPFKIYSEYAIILLLGVIGVVFWKFRKALGGRVAFLILGAIGLTMLSEYCFTLYDHPYALANMTGHFLMAGSIFLLYRALIAEGLHRPLESLAQGVRQREEELRNEIAVRSAILDQATDAIIATDLDLRITSWNRAATRIYGWIEEEAVGKAVDDLLGTEFLGQSREKARKILIAEGMWRGEVRQVAKNGQSLITEVSVSWLYNERGEITGGITVNRDITRRKAIEEALRRSEHRYRRIVETAQEGVWLLDEKGRTTYVNEKMAHLLGRDVREMLGRSFMDFHFPEDVPAARELFQRRKSGIAEQHDSRLCRKDGSELWTIAGTTPLHDVDGRFEGALGMFADITERKLIEDQLRASQARYQAVVNDQTELICRSAANGALTFVNPAYCRYFGQAEEELLGQSFMPLVYEEDREFVRECMASLNRDNPIAVYEQRVVLPGGELRWQEWTDRAIFDDQGCLVEYQSVGRDVTERKILEQRLLQAREREQARLGQELHDGLCQDLKAMELEAALMENACARGAGEGAAMAAELGRRINQAVRTAYAMARGLLPVGVDAQGLPAALAELVRGKREQSRIALRAGIQEDAFPSDAEQARHLFRIAQEALGNAIRHSGCTQIALTWSQSVGMLVLEIEDDGHGFAPNASDAQAPGIGLIVMRSRAQAMGAALHVNSGPGRGTRVRCMLPGRT